MLTVWMLLEICASPCPFMIPISTRNAIVFMMAPMVMQSTNHFVSVLRMLNVGAGAGGVAEEEASSMALSSTSRCWPARGGG